MTKKFIALIATLFILAYFDSCKFNPFQTNDKNFVFSYNAFDSTGTKIVRGWMRLTIEEDQKVGGNWIFRQIVDDVAAGPQNGAGKLSGQIQDSLIFINLNPDYVDNNVFLSADWDEQRLEGKWQFVGFPGVINEGTFVATRDK